MDGGGRGAVCRGGDRCGPEIKRLRDERDALFAQNQEAQNLIDDLRRANDALNMENSTLRSDLAGGPAPIQETGFEDVGDGVTSTVGTNSVTVSVPGDLCCSPPEKWNSAADRKTRCPRSPRSSSRNIPAGASASRATPTPIRSRNQAGKDNLELSLQRSAAVHRYLDAQGVAAELMYAAGFGQHKAKENKKLSRRVEIVVLLGDE